MSNVIKQERDKYEHVWTHKDYRRFSPGEQEMEQAFAEMTCRAGMSLNDYGSGPARATKWFQQQGLDVLGVDIAANAAETDVPVINTCLWDMSDEVGVSDFAFCCDVMEHIPTEFVGAVLREIVGRTRAAGWFRIATRPDVFGPRLGIGHLHLTIRDCGWWAAELSEVFSVVQVRRRTAADSVYLVLP